jgi:hypothetical protein
VRVYGKVTPCPVQSSELVGFPWMNKTAAPDPAGLGARDQLSAFYRRDGQRLTGFIGAPCGCPKANK